MGSRDAFKECPDCGHANILYGCTCDNYRCVCYKKNNDDWNGSPDVNGGGFRRPMSNRRTKEYNN